jgi:hypothetical protein
LITSLGVVVISASGKKEMLCWREAVIAFFLKRCLNHAPDPARAERVGSAGTMPDHCLSQIKHLTYSDAGVARRRCVRTKTRTASVHQF